MPQGDREVLAQKIRTRKIRPFLSHRPISISLSPLVEHFECGGAMAQNLCLPSSHSLRRHLFLVSGEEPCDHCQRQEDEHRLAVLTRRMARHLLLDDKEMPEKAEGCLQRGILGSTKEPSLALYAAPPEKNGALKCVFDPTWARQQLQAAHFQQLKRLQAMNQNSRARQQSKNRGCGRGNGETRPWRGCPFGPPPSAWPPLLKPPPSLPHHRRSMLLGTSSGRKESTGTGVFLPRVAATKFVPRKKSTSSSTDVVHYKIRQASTLNLSLNTDDDTLIARRNAMLFTHHDKHHHHDHFLRAQPATATADAPVAAHEIELPQEWTY